MRKSQFKGYIFEDIVSYLIQVNGFDLITEPNADDLINHGNGLNVVGRGGNHQTDTLGNLNWDIPFVYPIRLFVEAKAIEDKVGIDVVRKGIGIINDLNQNYKTVDVNNLELSKKRFDYHYAIFSLSGFSEPALRMAIAHKVDTIDLSMDNLIDLKNKLEGFTEAIFNRYGSINNEISKDDFQQIRKLFRNRLGLRFAQSDKRSQINDISNESEELIREALSLNSIYLATLDTPFMVALVPNDNDEFNKIMLAQNHRRGEITWKREHSNWKINIENSDVVLEFSLPEILREYIFKENRRYHLEKALEVKESYLSKFTFVIEDSESNQSKINRPVYHICSISYDNSLLNQENFGF